MASRTLRIEILGDAKKASAAFSQAEQSAGSFADRMSHLSTKMQDVGKKMTTNVTLPIVGMFGLATKAAMEDEASASKLEGVLKNVTHATDKQVAATEDWILKTSLASGVADDKLRPAFQNLVVATKDVSKAQDQMRVAMDIATAKGLDLETVTKAMAKAHGGNVGALGKLGIATKDAAGQTLSFDQIMKNANETFGGATAKNATTAAGKMQRLKVQLAEAGEQIGTALLPVLAQLGEWLGKIASWFSGLDGTTRTWIIGIGLALAVLGPLLTLLGTLGTVLSFLAANPIVLIIAAFVAIGVALYALYQKNEEFRALVDSVWAAIQAAISAAADALEPVFENLVSMVQGFWEILVGIKDFIVGVFTGDWSRAWEGIKQIFSGAWQAIVGLVGAAWEWIKLVVQAGFAAVWGIVQGIGNWLSNLWSSIWGGITGGVSGAWEWIKAIVNDGMLWVLDKINGVGSWISGVWTNIWNGISDFFGNIWSGIKDTFKNSINGLIGFLNSFIDKWNSISIEFSTPDVPGTDWGGQDIKIDLPDLPHVPKLAAGGVVMPRPGGTPAIIGEAGAAEAVIPLTPKFLGQLGGGGAPTIVVNVGGSVIAERDLAQTVYDGLLDLFRRNGGGF